jgi:hypothetical protein
MTSAVATFPVVVARDRNRRSGISGAAAVLSRARKATRHATAAAKSVSVRDANTPSLDAGPTIAYTASITAAVTSTAPGASVWRSWRRTVSAGTYLSADTTVATPIGTLMKKIQCQSRTWAIPPPARTPMVPPAAAMKP